MEKGGHISEWLTNQGLEEPRLHLLFVPILETRTLSPHTWTSPTTALPCDSKGCRLSFRASQHIFYTPVASETVSTAACAGEREVTANG